MAWCVHDLQHLIGWGAADVGGIPALDRQVAWLAGVLEARGMPPEHLAASLEIAAGVVRERAPAAGALADRLQAGAATLRAR